MAENITIARPYAKAVFDLAKNGNVLDDWDKFLSYLSIVVDQEVVILFVKNKTISYSDKAKTIIEFLDSLNLISSNIQALCINFVNQLSYYGRLLCVKDLYALYKQYMNLELGRVEAVVKVAYIINNSQKDSIVECLAKRFNKKVSALFETDESLLGGFLIRVGDFVLDGSISGNLFSLRNRIMM